MGDAKLLDAAAIVWAWWERRDGETIDEHIPELRKNLAASAEHAHEGDCSKAPPLDQGPWTCPRCVADDLLDVARRLAAVFTTPAATPQPREAPPAMSDSGHGQEGKN
jgi:hypothetical protein